MIRLSAISRDRSASSYAANHVDLESSERITHRVPSAQHREPRQAHDEHLQRDELEQASLVRHRHPVLVQVVALAHRITLGPGG